VVDQGNTTYLRFFERDFLAEASPLANAPTRQRDSSGVQFGGGNAWKEIGTWTSGIADSPLLAELEVGVSRINAGIPTTLPVQVSIGDMSPTPAEVVLHRLNEAGGIVENLANMKDDGKGPDAIASDRRYSSEVMFNEPLSGRIRLRASATLSGELRQRFSTDVVVLVLPRSQDTSAEEFLRAAGQAFTHATTVEDVLPFIDPKLGTGMRELVNDGVPLTEIGRVLVSARLNWKTANDAEFRVTVAATPGDVSEGRIVVHRFPEGWKIVSF